MTDVFLCEKGQISAADKKALRTAGVVVVEAVDPSKCQFVRATETVSADDMLWAALDALRRNNGYGSDGKHQREQLAHNLFVLVNQERKAQGKVTWKDEAKS